MFNICFACVVKSNKTVSNSVMRNTNINSGLKKILESLSNLPCCGHKNTLYQFFCFVFFALLLINDANEH